MPFHFDIIKAIPADVFTTPSTLIFLNGLFHLWIRTHLLLEIGKPTLNIKQNGKQCRSWWDGSLRAVTSWLLWIYTVFISLFWFSGMKGWKELWLSYMPYLTLWDKISQNLAHLEGNSHKKFQSHRIFRPLYNIFHEEININHTLLWFSQAPYMN